MAWTTPLTWLANQIVTAAEMNTHVRDNLNELRNGGIAVASQASNDFLYASSATQLARLGPAAAGQVPIYNGTTWVMSQLYGVGDICVSTSSTNPATRLGYGTWAAFGAGRVLVGIDASQAEFDTIEETGGEKTHTLTTAEMPTHTHVQDAHAHTITVANASSPVSPNNRLSVDVNDAPAVETGPTDSTTATNQNTGGGGAHNNLQPYVVVYMWRRTA